MKSTIPFLATRGARLVAPFFPEILWRVPESEPVAYLTFDDGPTQVLTSRLLDLLARHDARATCFLMGARAERDPELVRALHAAGHTVGNHTYTHPDPWRLPAPVLYTELDRTTKLLEDTVQAPVRWTRPPYGRFTSGLRAWCRAHAQTVAMWDVMPGDFLASATSRNIEDYVLRHLRPGSVVVLHDHPAVQGALLPALDGLLEKLTAAGWRFEALQAPTESARF